MRAYLPVPYSGGAKTRNLLKDFLFFHPLTHGSIFYVAVFTTSGQPDSAE
jgi:hypothetical protein